MQDPQDASLWTNLSGVEKTAEEGDHLYTVEQAGWGIPEATKGQYVGHYGSADFT